MSITLEGQYLRATITGKFSLREAKETFLLLLDAMATHQTHRVLIDGLGVTGEPSSIERYGYGTFAAAEVLHRIRCGQLKVLPQFAYLLIPPVRDPGRFGENVAWNRGLDVRTFERSDEAVNWLVFKSNEHPTTQSRDQLNRCFTVSNAVRSPEPRIIPISSSSLLHRAVRQYQADDHPDQD